MADELAHQSTRERWAPFTDAEIEVLADRVDSPSLGDPPDRDPDYGHAHLDLFQQLDAERRARGFQDSCRPGSPYLEDDDG